MAGPGPREGQPIQGVDHGFRHTLDRVGRGLKKHGSTVGLTVVLGRFAVGGGGEVSPSGKYSADTDNGGSRVAVMAKDAAGASVSAGNGDGRTLQAKNTSTSSGYDGGNNTNSRGDQSVNPRDQVPNAPTVRNSTVFDGAHDKGPNSARIAQQRSSIRNEKTYGNPVIINKGKQSDIARIGDLSLDGIESFAAEVVHAVADAGGAAAGYLLSGPTLSSCARQITTLAPMFTPTPEKLQGNPTPTIIPVVEQKDVTYAKNLVASADGPVSDVGSGVTQEVALLRKFKSTVGALIANDGNLGSASDYQIVLPISPGAVTAWVNNPENEPAWYIQKNGSPNERYIVTVNTYYNEAGLLPMPPDAKFEITPRGTSSIIIPGNGGWNELVDLPQLDRRWMPRAGMFLDMSNIPKDARDITSEIVADMDYSYGFARKIYDQDPHAQLDLIPSINRNGEAVFAVRVKYSTGQEVIYGQANQPLDHNFYTPPLKERQKVRLGNDGSIIVQVAGTGINTGETYDAEIFNPNTQSLTDINQSPLPAPTVTPSPTDKPTVAPAVTEIPTVAPKPTNVPDAWTSSEDITVKGVGINEWESRVHIEASDADQAKLREEFRLLRFVKNQHTLPAWAVFPFSTDNPLKFLNNVTYIHVDRGQPPYAYGGGTINLNPTYPDNQSLSQETLWIATAGSLMKEASYNAWFKAVKKGDRGTDSYADWVTMWSYIYTLQDIHDANGGKTWVVNGQKVGEELERLINVYTSQLNNKAVERGWK